MDLAEALLGDLAVFLSRGLGDNPLGRLIGNTQGCSAVVGQNIAAITDKRCDGLAAVQNIRSVVANSGVGREQGADKHYSLAG